MSATTDSRLLSLVTCVLELVRDGKRDGDQVCNILQGIKDSKSFSQKLPFKIWRTLAIGGLAKNDLFVKLAKAGRNVSNWADSIMNKAAFVTSPESCEVSFVRATVKDLGFTQIPTTTEIIARVKEVGQLCRPEDGPWLALQNLERGDWLWLVMEPIVASYGSSHVFRVGRDDDGDRWLSAFCVYSDGWWSLDGQLVFRARK